MKRLLLTSVLLTMVCAPLAAQAGDNSFFGTAIGASLGGYLGSTMGRGSGRLATTGAGVFLGGLVGNSIGSSMDRTQSYPSGGGYYAPYYQTYSYYEPTYVAPEAPPPPQVVYVQPTVVEYRPIETPVYVQEGYVGGQGAAPERHCREFTQTIKIDGQVHESYGTACLRPDGTWQIER